MYSYKLYPPPAELVVFFLQQKAGSRANTRFPAFDLSFHAFIQAPSVFPYGSDSLRCVMTSLAAISSDCLL